MKATTKNIERVMKFITERHADNDVHGEFDDDSDLLATVKKAIEQVDEEALYMCNSCHEHFPAEEMDMDVEDDQDLCKNCNFVSYNDAPYGDK
jgi:formylmethanofuran dehydrogenase subunit E